MSLPPQPSERRVHVRTAGGGYDVRIGAGLLASLGTMVRNTLGDGPRKALLAHDDKLPAPLVQTAADALTGAGLAVSPHALHAAETVKSLDALGGTLVAMAQARMDRADVVIALGGGIVGDVAGFAAATYRRGCPLVQCPTTLLAMVDASVGGKTGVNLGLPQRDGSYSFKKNMVGAFHQPALVVADAHTLASLPTRELHAGLAECVKHAMIACTPLPGAAAPVPLANRTPAWLAGVARRDHGAIIELIEASVTCKARFVEGDEHEQAPDSVGGRAMLNLGHTFAHAIETLPTVDAGPGRPPPALHGEAVALGLWAATTTSRALGLCGPGVLEWLESALALAQLPRRAEGLPGASALLDAMYDDKKVRAGRLRLILPVGDEPGQARVVTDARADAVLAGWRAIGAA